MTTNLHVVNLQPLVTAMDPLTEAIRSRPVDICKHGRKTSVWLEPDLIRRLKMQAAAEQRHGSEVMAEALRRYLAEKAPQNGHRRAR